MRPAESRKNEPKNVRRIYYERTCVFEGYGYFDDYCSWLFGVFFEVQKRIDLETDADEYHRRVFGFISEFLLLVWTTVNQLRVFECKVGMIGEKAETRELKEQIAVYLEKRDVAGAKKYFMDCLSARTF